MKVQFLLAAALGAPARLLVCLLSLPWRLAAEGVSMTTALSTLYDPADAFVAWLACDGGPWQLVCSAPTEELCRQRLTDWAAINQPCEVRVMRTGTKPQRRPSTNRRKPKE
jgi:hypothetical protein